MKKANIAIIICTLFIGCKDSESAQFSAMGKEHHIRQYGADGQIIGSWTSTGSVSNEKGSDGWYFEDSATLKLVEITGTVQVEVK